MSTSQTVELVKEVIDLSISFCPSGERINPLLRSLKRAFETSKRRGSALLTREYRSGFEVSEPV